MTVIIESVLAAFHMDEILYELRERAVGLRLGKWDYAFNYLKRLHRNGATLWPDREHLDGPQPFLEAVARLMVQTCRRRGAHAIGGKINHDPRTTDRQRKDRLFEQVLDNLRADVSAGCNGTQVAHPGLVPIAVGVFDASGNGDNGGSEAPLVPVTREDLLTPPTGPITESGLRENIHLVVRYLAHWMNGRGSVELADRVSNAANAEFARALTWHWIRRSATLEDGRAVTPDLVRATIQAELDDVEEQIGELGTMALRYNRAADLAERLLVADRLDEFMTTVAYAELS